MTTQQLEIKATENIKNIINCISFDEYEKLILFTAIEGSWLEDEESQEDGLKIFEEWLKGQLEMWAEDEEKEFVIDKFDKNNLSFDSLSDNEASATYKPTSYGEELDFWFEFFFSVNDNDELTSIFSVNI